ncbi:MAG: acyltransferase family protein [Acidimicrobiales bacterium]
MRGRREAGSAVMVDVRAPLPRLSQLPRPRLPALPRPRREQLPRPSRQRPPRPEGQGGQRRPPARYWPGLDGMRALAVTAVVVYHLDPAWLPGGFFGVDIFFVISGYLITSILADEWARTGSIGLKRFWLRRARRLLPALAALIAALIVVSALLAPGALVMLRASLPAVILYQTNWWLIFHHVSYFQSIGRPPLVLHLWSLAIEEQYYLIWPPLLALGLMVWRRPGRIAVVALIGAAGSCVLMALLYHPGAPTDRLYFGTDTHSQGLLLGSALGLLVPPGRMSAAITAAARRRLDMIGAAALAGLFAAMALLEQESWVTWRLGFAGVAAMAGMAVLVAAHPASRLAGVLSARPLRWAGARSYSIYLWHWPVIDLTRPHQDLSFGGPGLLLLRVALILGLAEASYRFVERPWRTGAAQSLVKRIAASRPSLRWPALASVAGGVTLLALPLWLVAPPRPAPMGATATAAASRQSPRATSIAIEALARREAAIARQQARQLNPSFAAQALRKAAAARAAAQATATTTTTATTEATPPLAPGGLLRAAPGGPVLAIGDSVMLGSAPDLQSAFGAAITVDAKVGRQVSQGLSRLQAYRAAGGLKGLRALVIGLGTNGPFSPSQFQQLVNVTAGVPHVIVVNVRVPRSWQSFTNSTLAAGVASNPRFSLVHWHHASAAPGLLWPDMVHPDPAGQRVYSNLIVQAVDSAAG